MLLRLLPAAIFAAGLSAQPPVLVYDNGPFETAPGLSVLESTTLGHTTYGWGVQWNSTNGGNSIYDNFEVCSAMLIEEVEVYTYQTSSGTASTITGCYLEFYDADPVTGAPTTVTAGSPAFTLNHVTTPNNPVFNTWTNVYRVTETTLTSTARPLMRVRVKLEDASGTAMPLVLLPGRYWMRYGFQGSAASGPWTPPTAATGQRVTGDALQSVGGGVPGAIFNGSDATGFPFKFYGQPTGFPGSITQVVTGCGATTLDVNGSANIDGWIRATVNTSVSSSLAFIGLDIGGHTPGAFCSCNTGVTWTQGVLFASTLEILIPNDCSFQGFLFTIGGAAFGDPGGCSAPVLTLTDTYEVQIGRT